MWSRTAVLAFFPALFYVFQIFCNISKGISKSSRPKEFKDMFVPSAKFFEVYAFSFWNA